MTLDYDRQNELNIQIKFKIEGGQDVPPKKKKNETPEIPINESDVSGLDYITEG